MLWRWRVALVQLRRACDAGSRVFTVCAANPVHAWLIVAVGQQLHLTLVYLQPLGEPCHARQGATRVHIYTESVLCFWVCADMVLPL